MEEALRLCGGSIVVRNLIKCLSVRLLILKWYRRLAVMDRARTYLFEFRAMLCPVVSQYAYEHTSITRALPKGNSTKDESAYQSRSDEVHAYLKEHFRTKIYLTITSYKFVEAIPLIREVDKLEYSNFDKMVIVMIVIGMDSREVAEILMSDINSIKTIRTRRRKAIEQIRQLLIQ